MKTAVPWLALRFPQEVTTTQALAALVALNGLSTPRRREVIALQAMGTANGVVHHLASRRVRLLGIGWRRTDASRIERRL